eukprot:COSAG06_NODE_1260_length_10074_cov_127.640000_2_plen_90_part_00
MSHHISMTFFLRVTPCRGKVAVLSSSTLFLSTTFKLETVHNSPPRPALHPSDTPIEPPWPKTKKHTLTSEIHRLVIEIYLLEYLRYRMT